jgi:hypothetical protein
VHETSFNNRLAQRPKGKQKRFIIEYLDFGVFVSQAHNLSVHLYWEYLAFITSCLCVIVGVVLNQGPGVILGPFLSYEL